MKLNNQRLRYRLVVILVLLSLVGGWVYSRYVSRLPESSVPRSVPKECGITKTATGYTFSWLHVEKGYIVSNRHCIEDLKGFNLMAIEFANGVGGFDTPVTEQLVAWFNKTFRMNIWRVPLNGYWWNANIYVPQVQMYYRDWIQLMVKWFEQHGNYVMLTFTSYFPNPPCVYDVQCSSQAQAIQNYQPNPADLYAALVQAQQDSLADAIAMWANIATLYANDPAVLYDGLNETCCISSQIWQDRENTIIRTIRTYNPRSLIFLGGPDFNGDVNPIIQGSVPNFSQPNLVYDFHVYDGYTNASTCEEPNSYIWQNWPLHANEQIAFAQQHNDAVAFNEWGGCVDVDDYNQKLTAFAQLHHVCLVYYVKDNVVTMKDGAYAITSNGLEVQRAYARW